MSEISNALENPYSKRELRTKGAGKGDDPRPVDPATFKRRFEEIRFTGVEGLKPIAPGRSRKVYE